MQHSASAEADHTHTSARDWLRRTLVKPISLNFQEPVISVLNLYLLEASLEASAFAMAVRSLQDEIRIWWNNAGEAATIESSVCFPAQ